MWEILGLPNIYCLRSGKSLTWAQTPSLHMSSVMTSPCHQSPSQWPSFFPVFFSLKAWQNMNMNILPKALICQINMPTGIYFFFI